ncbi:DUF2975 domain-containing protein [Catenuloplanes indicus]|uniref:DUF2975 domain-containing protein n=1 Tax=Catenuloplanes indicus TaxID=137267 RepID=A0AAE3VYM7_9ACTN|nr:DUF2975 domain-containing protein [Catenuloplanes indicus]MDQ0366027.1 hypothetical protein [Catenuloplanes indicus]
MINAQRDWLGELQTALGAGAVLGALAGVGTVIYAGVTDAVELTIVTTGETAISGLPAGVTRADGGAADVAVADPGWAERLAHLAQGAPSYLLGLLVVVSLWRIVRAARRTDPFVPGIAGRLRRLGLVTLVGGLVADTLETGSGALASTLVYGEFRALTVTYHFWWLLIGFGLLAVGEVLRRGAVLRAELDQVV